MYQEEEEDSCRGQGVTNARTAVGVVGGGEEGGRGWAGILDTLLLPLTLPHTPPN